METEVVRGNTALRRGNTVKKKPPAQRRSGMPCCPLDGERLQVVGIDRGMKKVTCTKRGCWFTGHWA